MWRYSPDTCAFPSAVGILRWWSHEINISPGVSPWNRPIRRGTCFPGDVTQPWPVRVKPQKDWAGVGVRGGEPFPQAPDGSPGARTPSHLLQRLLVQGCQFSTVERLHVTPGLPRIQDTDIARESKIRLLILDRDALLPCILGSFLATTVLFCVPGTTLCYWAS